MSVLLRELELQRKSSATDIAKKKLEAESAVSTRAAAAHSSWWGVIDRGFWVFFFFFLPPLTSLCLKKRLSNSILLSSAPPSAPRLSLSPSAPLQVLLMQESVRRIIEAEESKMGQRNAHTQTHTRARTRSDRLDAQLFML